LPGEPPSGIIGANESFTVLVTMPKIVDHEERKTVITKAVLKSIAKNGLANTTIRGISKEGGFSSGTLAHYFGDKDELINFAFQAVSDESHERIRNRVADIFSAKEKLRIVIDELTPSPEGVTDSQVSLAFWSAVRHDERLLQKFRDVYGDLRDFIRSFINEGICGGEFRATGDLEADVDVVVAVTDGLLISFLLDPSRFPPARRAEVIDVALNAALARLIPD
jgi:AcrR family transcriptional regulator